jgi:hypothetical protein
MIDDKAIAVVDGEWRSAREIYAILDEGAFVSTAAALVRLADAGKIERRHDPYRNVKVRRYRSQNQTQSPTEGAGSGPRLFLPRPSPEPPRL